MGTVSERLVSLVLAVACVASLGACGAAVPRASAELRVVAEPASARVYINDRFVATGRILSRRPERLRTGVHHVTIQADGYFPHDVEVDLPEGLTTLEVGLRPIPP
jgi:hypothetical protein